MVQRVECFRAHLERQPLKQLELPADRHVHIEVSGAPQAVVGRVPKRAKRVGCVKTGIQVLVFQAMRHAGIHLSVSYYVGPIKADTRGSAPGASRTVPVWQTAQLRYTTSIPRKFRIDTPTGNPYFGSTPLS